MKRKRHTPDEIIRKLRQVQPDLSSRQAMADVCKRLGVSKVKRCMWGWGATALRRCADVERKQARDLA